MLIGQVWAAGESISIGIDNNSTGNGPGYSGTDAYGWTGAEVVGNNWNNTSGAVGSSISNLKLNSGVRVKGATFSVVGKGGDWRHWGASQLGGGTRDYADGPWDISLSNIPFSKYSVVLFMATDNGEKTWGPVKVTSGGAATYYTYKNEDNNKILTITDGESLTGWGLTTLGQNYSAEEGVNVMIIPDLSGDISLLTHGTSGNDATRGGLYAIQIINTGDLKDREETIAVDGVSYDYVFRGTRDANWATLGNWYIGKRITDGQETWLEYSDTTVPTADGSNKWGPTLFDGNLIQFEKGSDGYKTVNMATEVEGWNLRLTAMNGVHLVIENMEKQQSGDGVIGFIRVDDTSKITVKTYDNGNKSGLKSFYVNAPEGLVFESPTSGQNISLANVEYLFDEDGSVVYPGLSDLHTIKSVKLDLGNSELQGRKIVSRKLIGFTGGEPTFNANDCVVTTTEEDIEAKSSDVLLNVGDYKFVALNDGYYVNFVAYSENDELALVSEWSNKTEDGLWVTEENWSNGLPGVGAATVINITRDTTITVPDEGVVIGLLTVKGMGTLTITGGKITATKLIAETNISASGTTLLLAPMEIAEGVTVAYTMTGDDNSEVSLPALTGEGTFSKFGPERLSLEKTRNCDPQIIVNAGTLRFKDQVYEKTYDIVAKNGATIQIGTWTGSLTSSANTLKFDGGATLWLYNGNNSAGSAVNGTITIDSSVENPVIIKGSSFGNNSNIAAAIKGVGAIEIHDYNDNYFTISGVIANGDAEGDVLAVKVVTDRGVTFTGANTYTGGTVVAAGATLKVQKMSALGAANTEVNIAKGGKVTVTSTGNVTEDSGVARAVFAGEGTVEFNGSGYYVLANNFKAPAYLINNQAENLTISTDGTYEVGSYSGGKYFRMDYNQKGNRAFVITQRADATIASDIVQMFGSITDAERLTDVTVKGVDGATLTLSGAHNNIHFRTLTIDATGSVNLAGGWKGDVDAYGIIAGMGTIGGKLKLQNGATLDVSAGALNVTGEVWVMNGANNTASVTLPENYAVDTPIVSCSNAEAVAADLSAKMPTGYKCVADGNTVKLAVATVNVTIPAAPANTKWYDANGNVVEAGTIAVEPNTDVTLTLKAEEGYVFADGSTSKDYTVNSGENGATVETPDVTAATPVAQVGETKYQTLQAAVNAANAGATVTVIADIVTDGPITVSKKVTVNFGGKTIAATNDTEGNGVFYVVTGGDLTLEGEGTVNALGPNAWCMAVWAKDGGKVIINGGTYTNVGATSEEDGAHFDLIYVRNGGSVEINGGTFICQTPRWTLNSRNDEPGTFVVKGGTFKDFNPAAVNTDDNVTTWCADGYTATEGEEGYWTVVLIPVSNNVAKIGETEYETLQDALDSDEAKTEGVEVVLLKDTTEDISISAGFNGTINLGEKTLTGHILASGTIAQRIEVALTNGIMKAEGDVDAIKATYCDITLSDLNFSTQRHGLRLNDNATAIINSGTYVISNNYGSHLLYLSGANTELTIYDGVFSRIKVTTRESYGVNVQKTTSKVNIYGGEFSGFSYIFDLSKVGVFNVYGGTYLGTSLANTNKPTIMGGVYEANPSKYLASGYTIDTAAKPGFYTVVEKPAIVPSGSIEVEAADEEAAAAKVEILIPEGVTGVDAATYATYFTKTAKYDESTGKYTVTAALNPEVVTPKITAISFDGDKVTVSLENGLNGLYYAVRSAATVDKVDTAEATVTTGLNAPATGDAAFYRVLVDFAPIPATPAE